MKKLKQLGFALLLSTMVSVGCSKSGGDNSDNGTPPSATEYVNKGNTLPSSATAGTYYFDTTSKILYQKNGSSWTPITSISNYTDGDIYIGSGSPSSSIGSKYFLDKASNKLYKKEGNNWVQLIEEAINIPDENFRKALSQWDIDKNGKISIAEAKAPTALFLNAKGIRDLTGIEFFTNLEKLEVNDNQLTKLNIGALTRLQTIKATNNNISGFLDFSKLTALSTVQIVKGGSNSAITGIKVASKQLADKFNIEDSTHKYTHTDAVDEILNINQKLKDCIINSQKTYPANQRVDANGDGEITKQEALAYKREITCLSSQYEVDDISDLKYFSNISKIRVEGQILNNTNLVLQDFPNLVTVQMERNNIKDVILRNLPLLETIELGNNAIININFDNLSKLNKLNLQQNRLTAINLGGLTTIKQLNLIGNYLSGTLDISHLNLTLDDAQNISIKKAVGSAPLSNTALTSIIVANQELADRLNVLDGKNQGTFYRTNSGGSTDPNSSLVIISDKNLRSLIYRTFFPNKVEGVHSITKAEAASIRDKKIQIIDTRISDLSGLEHFINISEMEIGASVSNIDLSPFVNLYKVTFTGNSIITVNTSTLTNLTNVDIQSPNLQRLDLSKCNKLTSVTARQGMKIECIKVPANLVNTLKTKTNYSKDAIKAECN